MTIRIATLALFASSALFADWAAVEALPPGQRLDVLSAGGERTRGSLVSAGPESLVVETGGSARTLMRADVRRVRVPDPKRRVRQGLLWTAAGAGAGLAIGFGVCPQCSNEGSGGKYVGPAAAIGAGVGALGFLRTPRRTVYEAG